MLQSVRTCLLTHFGIVVKCAPKYVCLTVQRCVGSLQGPTAIEPVCSLGYLSKIGSDIVMVYCRSKVFALLSVERCEKFSKRCFQEKYLDIQWRMHYISGCCRVSRLTDLQLTNCTSLKSLIRAGSGLRTLYIIVNLCGWGSSTQPSATSCRASGLTVVARFLLHKSQNVHAAREVASLNTQSGIIEIEATCASISESDGCKGKCCSLTLHGRRWLSWLAWPACKTICGWFWISIFFCHVNASNT